ncbi:hypothetical protein RGQ29_003390 [Quercus rubra]|uniref:Uncharacterized protein n=1 Tax=Quercus rubra TaxID=3512 RepID=A0AAN7IF10_QUERU|nr:hypothetical protein RGQ29_003390 [Quercus rubra]
MSTTHFIPQWIRATGDEAAVTRLTSAPSQRLLRQQNEPRSNGGATRTKAKGADGVEAKNGEGCWRSGSKSGITDGCCHWFGQV